MATRVTGPGQLTFGDTTSPQKFDADVTSCKITPKADTDDADEFLDGHSESGAQTVANTLEGTVKDNFGKDSVQVWSWKNAGKTVPFLFVPNNEGEIGVKGNILVAPLAIGGDVKKKNDQDFSFTATDVVLTDTAGQPLDATTTPANTPDTTGTEE